MVSFSMLGLDIVTIVFIVLLVLLIVALLVVPMFTNKKRARETEELHNSLKPGDKIKTVGGIIGTIKEIRQISPVDKEMVIETGAGDNKTTMTFDIMALYQVMSRTTTTVGVADEPPKKPEPAKKEEPVEAQTVVAKAEEPAEEAAEPAILHVEEPPAQSEDADAAQAEPEPAAEQAAAKEQPAQPKEAAPAAKPKNNNGSNKNKKNKK